VTGTGTPTGFLSISDSVNGSPVNLLVGQGNLGAFGTLGYSWVPKVRGTHVLTARYLGDPDFADSTVSVTFNVSGCASIATPAGPASAVVGTRVTVSAPITSTTCFAGAPAPTGSVTIAIGADTCVSSTSVTCQFGPSVAGFFPITAKYPVDAVYEPSLPAGSAFIDVNVALSATIDPGDWAQGEPVTISWSVTARACSKIWAPPIR